MADNPLYNPFVGALVAAILFIGSFAFWVWALVDAARNGKWVWFVLTLVFPLLCIVYLLFAYEGRPMRAREVQRIEPGLRDPRED